MKWMGLQSFRFSASWSRLQPAGKGPLIPEEVAYYSDLIDALLEAGIEPVICLNHWEVPQTLEDEIGLWKSPEMPHLFADFSGKVVEALSDRVSWWLTMNEPLEFVNGAMSERRAPEGACDEKEAWVRLKHVLLGHGLCVRTIREKAVLPPKISLANVCNSYFPTSETPEDLEAARRANFESWSDN